MGRTRQVLAGSALLLASACGRFGFEGDDAPTPVDGSAGDATDAALADARELDPTICDELTGVLLCDSFEDPSILDVFEAAAPSSIQRDETRPYRGRFALHAKTTRPNEAAWVYGGQPLADRISGDLYARFYLYIAAGPAPQDFAPLFLVDGAPPNYGAVLRSTTTATSLGISEPAQVSAPGDPLPRDRWTCVAIHIAIDPGAGAASVETDGIAGPSLAAIDTQPAGGYDAIHAGIYAYDTGVQIIVVWIDELVAATTPIPCD